MRLLMGMLGLLSVGVTVANSQPPTVTGPSQRSARLLPPQPLTAAEPGPLARASSEELPRFLDSTPVTRSTPKASSGPAWLNGTDSQVRPASGVVGPKSAVRPLTPPDALTPEQPGYLTKGLEKLKSVIQSDPLPQPRTFPTTGSAQVGTPTPTAPFRGTTTTGAPVYAGPPAYRWYGWGTVTPGANPYAPTGQYPQASANWYAITGATPGAFPIPVMNPRRVAPGTEPPAYATMPAVRTPPPVLPAQGSEPTTSSGVGAPSFLPPPADLAPQLPLANTANPATTPPALPPTRLVPPAAPEPPPVTIPQPIGNAVTVPTLTPVPVAPGLKPTEPEPMPTPSLPPPVNSSNSAPGEVDTPSGPGVVSSEHRLPPIPVIAPESPLPTVLPGSTPDEQPTWQPSREKPASDQWAPVGKASELPPNRGPVMPAGGVARGQADDGRADSVGNLIRKLCEGRASGVDVRWTGSKKLTVCFECRSAPAAQQLVKDISARPELGPYQIDFCVLVK